MKGSATKCADALSLTVSHFCRPRTKRPTSLPTLSGQPRATHTVLRPLHPLKMFGDISRSVLGSATPLTPQSLKS